MKDCECRARERERERESTLSGVLCISISIKPHANGYKHRAVIYTID